MIAYIVIFLIAFHFFFLLCIITYNNVVMVMTKNWNNLGAIFFFRIIKKKKNQYLDFNNVKWGWLFRYWKKWCINLSPNSVLGNQQHRELPKLLSSLTKTVQFSLFFLPYFFQLRPTKLSFVFPTYKRILSARPFRSLLLVTYSYVFRIMKKRTNWITKRNYCYPWLPPNLLILHLDACTIALSQSIWCEPCH